MGSAYLLWLGENRERIGEEVGKKDMMKAAGAEWRKLSKAKKEPYEKRWQEEKALKPAKKKPVEAQKAAVKDSDKPRRPLSAYFLFVNANRERITKEVGNPRLYQAAGEEWKAMSEAEKEPWMRLNEEEKERYEAEIVQSYANRMAKFREDQQKNGEGVAKAMREEGGTRKE